MDFNCKVKLERNWFLSVTGVSLIGSLTSNGPIIPALIFDRFLAAAGNHVPSIQKRGSGKHADTAIWSGVRGRPRELLSARTASSYGPLHADEEEIFFIRGKILESPMQSSVTEESAQADSSAEPRPYSIRVISKFLRFEPDAQLVSRLTVSASDELAALVPHFDLSDMVRMIPCAADELRFGLEFFKTRFRPLIGNSSTVQSRFFIEANQNEITFQRFSELSQFNQDESHELSRALSQALEALGLFSGLLEKLDEAVSRAVPGKQ